MAENVTLDYSKWNQALKEYSVATGKTLAEALNRQANNLCIQSIKEAKKASLGKVTRQADRKDLIWWHAWRLIKANSGMTRTEAHDKAMKNIVARQRAVGFIRGFFAAMSKQIRINGLGQTVEAETFSGIKPHYKPATDGNRNSTQAEMGVEYTYKRQDESATKAEEILWTALQKGIVRATEDMQKYTQRQIDKLARQYSG